MRRYKPWKYIYYRHKSQTPDMDDAEGVMERYCKYIYTNDETGRIRTQAILYNIYHLALHDKWFQARDLMLMSHLQESIHNADIVTQIIYNRTMVQLGLCAFRKGQMEDAHQVNYSTVINGGWKRFLGPYWYSKR